MDTDEVVGLLLVKVPGLYNSRIGCREIDLSKSPENLVITAEDLHEPAPLIGDDLQLLQFDAVYGDGHRDILSREYMGFDLNMNLTGNRIKKMIPA